MKREIVINTKNLIKSNMPLDEFLLLQVIFEKDDEIFDYVKNYPSVLQTLEGLTLVGHLKYAGDSIAEDCKNPEILDIADFSLSAEVLPLFAKNEIAAKVSDVDTWIQEYRNKFKGIKKNAMGDPKACLKKMKMFLKDNPEITKDKILKAVDEYLDNTPSTYVMQADYFIYKSGMDKIPTSKLLMYCENLNEDDIQQEETYREIL